MSNDDIITAVLAEEGQRYTDDPLDAGGPTKWGITLNTLAWAKGTPQREEVLRDLTEAEARAIYLQLYLVGPGFDRIQDARLRWQMVDFGVHSGPGVAIRKIQDILHLTVDGAFGPKTADAINAYPDPTALGNALVAARVTLMMGLVTGKSATFARGWARRALKFLAPRA